MVTIVCLNCCFFKERLNAAGKKDRELYGKRRTAFCAPEQTFFEITVKKTNFYFKNHCKYKRFKIPLRGENTKQYIVFY
jgi:hypothetical protein